MPFEPLNEIWTETLQNMGLAGAFSTKAEGEREGQRERQDDLLLPLGSVILDSHVFVGQNIRKMSPTLVVLVLSSLKSALGSNPKTGCPNLALITPHIFSCCDGFATQRHILWHTMTSVLPAGRLL